MRILTKLIFTFVAVLGMASIAHAGAPLHNWVYQGDKEVHFVAGGGDFEALGDFTGSSIDAGTVTLSTTCANDPQNDATPPSDNGVDSGLTIMLDTHDPWRLVEVHLDTQASCGSIPQTGKANPKVGKFETKSEPGVLTPATMFVDTTSTLDGSGSNVSLCIALHGEVFIPDDCTNVEGNDGSDFWLDSCSETLHRSALDACTAELDDCTGESGWVEGENFAPASKGKRNWAMHIEVDDDDFCVWEDVSK